MECITFDRHGETRKETNNQLKLRIIYIVLRTYGCETWTLNKKHNNRIGAYMHLKTNALGKYYVYHGLDTEQTNP